MLALLLLLGLIGLWLVGTFDAAPPFDGKPLSRKMLRTGWFLIFVAPVISVFGLWYVFAAPEELIVIDEQGVRSHRILAEGDVRWSDVRSVQIVPMFGGLGRKELRVNGDRGKLLSLWNAGTDKSFDEIAKAVSDRMESRWRG